MDRLLVCMVVSRNRDRLLVCMVVSCNRDRLLVCMVISCNRDKLLRNRISCLFVVMLDDLDVISDEVERINKCRFNLRVP
jgi:hypothetical protein